MSNQAGIILKIAHRGYSSACPENTLTAFQGAIDAGAQVIEFDVHLSADNVPVVIHDNDIQRTSNGHGFVKDLTFAELKAYTYANNFTNSGHVTIPCLEEVLQLAKGRVECNIEIKNLPYRYKGIEKRIVEMVSAFNMKDQVIISSFDHYCLQKVHDIDNTVRIGVLYEAVWITFKQELSILRPYSIHPSLDAFFIDHAAYARQNDIRVYPWVAKSKEEVETLKATEQVDGIMVNDLKLFD